MDTPIIPPHQELKKKRKEQGKTWKKGGMSMQVHTYVPLPHMVGDKRVRD